MTYEEFRVHLRRESFQPFRVFLKDGTSYEIRHPNLALAAESMLDVGIPAPDDPNPIYGERSVWVRWADVDRVEPLRSTAAPSA